MNKDNSGPAFPCTPEHSVRMNGEGGSGMSLRDYFAAKVVAAAICGGMADGATLSRESIKQAVAAAYVAADAMLAARSA